MTRARLQVLAAALLFSTGGAAIKAVELSGWQIACFRWAIAALMMLVLLPAARRIFDLRVIAVGVAYAATLVCYVLANRLTTAANTIFLQSAAPLYLLLLAPWLLGERLRRRDLAMMAVMAAGLLPFFLARAAPSATAPAPLAGNLLAALAGVSWAFVVVGLRAFGRREGGGGVALAAVTAGNLIACLSTLPMALPVAGGGASDWGIVLYLGTVQVALGYLFLTAGVRRLSALETSLLLLVEPVLNPLWAWWLHGERPTGWAMVGGALILGATAVSLFGGRSRAQPAEDPAQSSSPAAGGAG
jgi:drug/metabolite transporter (DMT)-like permease